MTDSSLITTAPVTAPANIYPPLDNQFFERLEDNDYNYDAEETSVIAGPDPLDLNTNVSCVEFLKHVLPDEGLKCAAIFTNGRPQQSFTSSYEKLTKIIQDNDAAGHTSYIGCAAYKTGESRKQENVVGAKAFWLDIDCGTDKPYPNAEDGIKAVYAFCYKAGLSYPTFVYSGNGVHCWWGLNKVIPSEQWTPAAKTLKELTQYHGLHADPSRTADIASILRPPETHNYKDPHNPKLVICRKLEPHLSADTFIEKVSKAKAATQVKTPLDGYATKPSATTANAVYENAEPSSLAKAADHCSQLARFRDTKGNIPEPEWYAGICTAAHCSDGNELAHTWSKGHPNYSENETDKKLAHALKDSGPTKCVRFEFLNPEGCKSCSHKGRITSPIQLGKSNLPNANTINPDDLATFQRLAQLPFIEYDRIRKDEAKKLGIRTDTLDDVVKRLRPASEKSVKNGRELSLPVPELWPDPIDGAKLLNELVNAFKSYVSLPEGAAEILALWVMHAHAFEASFITPRLILTSPEKRCGKTTCLRVLAELVPKKLMASGVTPAALFRTIEAVRPTFLIDEADSFATDNEELRGVLNSGHAKDGSIIRLVGEDHEPRQFSTWCPTVLAAIGKLPATIEDRAIVIPMRRKLEDETLKLYVSGQLDNLHILSRQAARFAHDNITKLTGVMPEIPKGLHDRAADNLRPLLSIADLAGEEWPERARNAALTLSGVDVQQEQSIGVLLLGDICGMFNSETKKLSSAAICSNLGKIEDKPWGEFNRGQIITPRQIAKLLKPYDIKSKDLRMNDDNLKGYEIDQFMDAFARYLPATAATSATALDPLVL